MDSLTPGTKFNPGRYPVVDSEGRALTPGARVHFRLQSHYINTMEGAGIIAGLDVYGGAYLLADDPHPIYDRQGFQRDKRRELYASFATFTEGRRVLSGKLGDPHEHGQVSTFIRVLSQAFPPRSAVRVNLPASPDHNRSGYVVANDGNTGEGRTLVNFGNGRTEEFADADLTEAWDVINAETGRVVAVSPTRSGALDMAKRFARTSGGAPHKVKSGEIEA